MNVILGTHAGGNGSPPKLVKAAREFEAILLQSWLEKMNKSFAGENESQDAAHDTISSMGAQAVATALSERGGIGIASMLVQRLQTGVTRAEE
jgi:Rod binding domain-containing protein